jgi:sporulation protein YabP
MAENIISNIEHQMNYAKGSLALSGVKEVLSFEDKEVVLTLTDRGMVVKGSELSVAELNLKTGLLKIDGQVHSISYTRSHEKLSFMKKLFK